MDNLTGVKVAVVVTDGFEERTSAQAESRPDPVNC
jgi:hypothetical protein